MKFKKKLIAFCCAIVSTFTMTPNVIALNSQALDSDNILRVSKKEILIGKENAEVIFTFQTEIESDSLQLYQNNNYIGTFVDSGNFAQDGDDIKGDGVYSLKYTIDVTGDITLSDNSQVAYYTYDVRLDNEKVSNEIKIDLVTPFTEQELTNMSKVDEAIAELANSSEFQALSLTQKINSAKELLTFLSEENLISSFTIKGTEIEIIYSSGIATEWIIAEFNNTEIQGDLNGDGEFSLLDIILLKKWLLNMPDTKLANWKNADFNDDNLLNIYDLLLMKKALIHNIKDETVETFTPTAKIESIGYSNELLELAHSENSSAIITSCAELENYLTPITQERTLQAYLAEYDNNFFEENILLLNSIYQSCGRGIMYQIDSVSYQGNQLKIKYSDIYELKPYPAIVNGLLAQVIVPKTQYHAENVIWTRLDETVETFSPTAKIESIGWSDELFELATSENSSAIITSCAELETYLQPITQEEIAQAYLAEYDNHFFEENVLLLNTIYQIWGEHIMYQINSVFYEENQLKIEYTDTCTADCILEPHFNGLLVQVAIPKTQYHAENVIWTEIYETVETFTPTAKIESIGYSKELFELATSENSSAIITSCAELENYLTPITQERTLQAYLAEYDNNFFEENILLLNSIYDNGTTAYQINSVFYEGNQLKIEYVDTSGILCVYEPVFDGLLAQVIIPKTQYHAENVVWTEIYKTF